METKCYNVVCYGDLYRIYVSSEGEIVAVHRYILMGTQHEVLEFDELPQEVVEKFETLYLK